MKKNRVSHTRHPFHPFSSARTKTILMMDLMIIFALILTISMIVPRAQSSIRSTTQNYMEDIAISYGSSLEKEKEMNNGGNVLKTAYMQRRLKDVHVRGVSSSYAYVVLKDGTILYHPDSSQIGKSESRPSLTKVLSKLKSGSIPSNGIASDMVNGVQKYDAYYIATDGSFLLVMSADSQDVNRPVTSMLLISIIMGLLVAVFAAFLGGILVRKILSPLQTMSTFVGRMINLDFSKSKESRMLSSRKDEFGVMARAIVTLQKKLAVTMDDIKGQSTKLFSSSEAMLSHASDMSQTTDQVDSAVSDIALGASSQAEQTKLATDSVLSIGTMIQNTSSQIASLSDTASSMKTSQATAASILSHLASVNFETHESIARIASQTKTTNASAAKIREVTGLIHSIAEETNLLSLNASIEAARAGDAGRGFAVVATQIQKLADQSSSSAKQIEAIIDQLINDSDLAVQTMDEVREVIDTQSLDVEETQKAFHTVSSGIASSIQGIQTIAENIRQMDYARSTVIDTVQNLAAIAEQNAASTEESSASMSSIAMIASDMEENSKSLKQIALDLDTQMNDFHY